MGMFDLNTKGFRQVFADRPVSRMVEELVANAFDENASKVHVEFEHLGGQDYRLQVTDDSPKGFEDCRREQPSADGQQLLNRKFVCELVELNSNCAEPFDAADVWPVRRGAWLAVSLDVYLVIVSAAGTAIGGAAGSKRSPESLKMNTSLGSASK